LKFAACGSAPTDIIFNIGPDRVCCRQIGIAGFDITAFQ
jgi:hypothetical protein